MPGYAIVFVASMVILAVSALLVLVRVWRGPTAFDRAIAVETLGLCVVAFLLMAAYLEVGRFFTDAAFGLALFSFVGVALLARFLGAGELSDE